ncbi:uncharacterized protein LOC124260587 [Haliotis rubra]|uniref:uncharacterized protein LOC124260587 n=1 Tax=Haliotis rubra TaxID=36100 RepID=UPI001EE51240|nr:uncharacterized protein LOC124260587 [Haliotis rubra]
MVNDEHNHQTVTSDIKAKETLDKLKVKAASTLQPMQSLYEEGLIDMRDGSWNDETKAIVTAMPTFPDDDYDKRILGFSTADNLCHLCESDTIYGDGTFYVAPTIFHQLYTIHGMVDGNMFPLVFFFLPDKKEDTYTRMFRLLVDAAATRGHHLDPQKIQMDYEVAARNASAIVFPRSDWKGCFFHFTQCVWRRTQQHHS